MGQMGDKKVYQVVILWFENQYVRQDGLTTHKTVENNKKRRQDELIFSIGQSNTPQQLLKNYM